MKLLNRFFLKGLVVVMPVTITIYVLVLICTKAESFFGHLIKDLLGPSLYVPGFGILLTITLITVIGILVSNFITGSIIKFFMQQFEKVPFIKAIYNPLKDLMSLFGSSNTDTNKKVVLVYLEKIGVRSIGLVTREEFDDLPVGTLPDGMIAVYIPMSYMLGGFTAIVPREFVQEVDIPVEQAIKLAITGWIRADKNAI